MTYVTPRQIEIGQILAVNLFDSNTQHHAQLERTALHIQNPNSKTDSHFRPPLKPSVMKKLPTLAPLNLEPETWNLKLAVRGTPCVTPQIP